MSENQIPDQTEQPQEETSQPTGLDVTPLYDHDKKEWLEVPTNQVHDLITSGRFTYQTGQKIPVVNAQGVAGEIDSDNAFNEFKYNGIKPLTKDLQQAFEDRELDKINEANFGDRPVDAFIGGVLRATTLGGSDVVANLAGVGDAANQVRERNAPAAFGGELLSTVSTAAATGLGSIAGAGARAATSAGEQVAARLGTGMAARVAAKAIPAATEGAYFGLGQGISEAALGNPDSLVDSIVSNVGAGALFGGGIGTAFGLGAEAKPAFDRLMEKIVVGTGDALSTAANKVGAKGLVAALNAKGQAEIAKEIPEYMSLPLEARQYIQQEGVAAYKALGKDIKPLIKESKEQITAMRKDLDEALSKVSDEARQATADAIRQTGDDILAAAQQASKQVDLTEQMFREGTASLTSWPSTTSAGNIGKAVEETVSRLKSVDNPTAVRAANKLEALFTSHPLTTAADEAAFYLKLQNTLKPYQLSSKLDDASKSLLSAWTEAADNRLINSQHAIVSELYKSYKTANEAAEALKGVADRTIFRITKSPMAGEKVVRSGADGAARIYDETKTLRTLINPQHRQAVETALGQFDQLAPELKQWQALDAMKNGTKKIAAQQAFQEALETKMRQLAPGAKVNVDEIEDIFRMVGGVKDVDRKLQKIREFQAAVAPSESLTSKAVGLMKALGKDVTPELQRLAQYEKQIRTYQQMAKVGGLPSMSAAKAAFGASVGNLPGVLLGMEKTTANKYADAITAVEALAQKGSRQLNKAIKTTTDALISKPVQRSARTISNTVDKTEDRPFTVKDQRKQYPELKKTLSAPLKPLATQAVLPQVSKAVDAKRMQVQQFLQDKLPQDPFQDVSLSINDTGYTPSDQELSKFYRYVHAVENPQKVLNSLAKGSASPEEVETLKTIYPQVYKALQDSVLDGIIEKKVNLSYQQKVTLSTLFDIPTDPTLRPDFIARMQASINKDEGGRPEGTGGNRKISIELSPTETVATEAQRITNKA